MANYTADFETTTDPNDCRVWAWAVCKIDEDYFFNYGTTIDDFIELCASPIENNTYYFHNLRFDSSFILNYLLRNGYTYIKSRKERAEKTFTTLITDMGQIYQIEVYFKVYSRRVNKVTFRDSLKIINSSVEKIAKDFDLPISKLTLDYDKKRKKGHQLTQHEVDYIKNDVEIMARALKVMFDQGLNKMTIGADALAYYKLTQPNFKWLFPILPFEIDADIRRSYRGGFTYLNPKYKEKQTGQGIILDVNSLYPAQLAYKPMPYGDPMFFEGQYQKDEFYPLYVQTINCSFKVKPNKIPTIQIRHDTFYTPNEYVEDTHGDPVTLTLTNIDLQLFLDHYDLTSEIKYYGGWKFKARDDMFIDYVEHWTAEKIKAKKEGNKSLYTISKLLLNNLYGKMGLNPKSRLKYPVLEDGVLRFICHPIEERKPIYIPVASFVTSYGRDCTIRTSQKIREFTEELYGEDGYVYSDTDSIHCLVKPEDVPKLAKFIDIDPYRLGAWDLEGVFTKGKYLHQKCYIEEIDNNIKVTVAGLPKNLGSLINFDNFRTGFTTAGLAEDMKKLLPQQVRGGVVLMKTEYTIK